MIFNSNVSPFIRGMLGLLLCTPIVVSLDAASASPQWRRSLFSPVSQQLAQVNSDCSSSANVSCETGGLSVVSEQDISQVFPLKQTNVTAKVAGNLSRVSVTQVFENPFEETLEAIYVFPLPDEAAVDDLQIKIGDRIIKSQIKKREEAQEIYQQAKEEGRTAGLLEQERDNIFTQSIANIKPGEKIEVTIYYTNSLKFQDGNYEFVFPMVVGPRYIPGNLVDGMRQETDQVPDADRITPPILPPNTRSGHNINVTVEIDAGIPIENIESPSHEIVTKNRGNIVQVNLADYDTIPNKDLILRYQVAGEDTQFTVLTEADSRGGHFAAYLIPAWQYQSDEIIAKDVIFLMDTSGSQRGEPLAKSKQLMRRFIQGLNTEDTFTIIDFSDTTTALSENPLSNTIENRQKALAYINQLEANGGTQLLNGIKTVLNFSKPPAGRLRSIVLITDGYIGNENEVLAEVKNELKSGNRLYNFGVGSSVNRFLLNRLAEVGRGTVQITRPDEPTEAVVEAFFRHINNPILTDIRVSWIGEGTPVELYPVRPSDLFDSQPLVLFGRKIDRRSGTLKVTATTASGDRYEQTLPVSFTPGTTVSQAESTSSTTIPTDFGNVAIAQLWGRAKIKHLMNQMFGGETKSGVEAVTQTALDYRLLSQYTAFVAVTQEVRVDPDGTKRTVEVPVELPEGVSYEGIFGPQAERNQSAGSRSTPSLMMQPAMPDPNAPSSSGAAGGRGSRQPNFTGQDELRTRLRTPESSRIEIIEATELNPDALAELNRYLQGVNLPSDVTGKAVFEVVVDQGNVTRIILDDLESTLKLSGNADQVITIDRIRRSLQTWRPPTDINGTVKITLQVK